MKNQDQTLDETWTQLRDLEANARLRNAIELFMMRGAPAKTEAGACTCPAGALSEDATAEIIEPTPRRRIDPSIIEPPRKSARIYLRDQGAIPWPERLFLG